MLKPRNDARLSPCEAFWQKHNGFLCEKPILPYEHSAKSQGIKQLMAGGGVALIGTILVPLLSGLFG